MARKIKCWCQSWLIRPIRESYQQSLALFVESAPPYHSAIMTRTWTRIHYLIQTPTILSTQHEASSYLSLGVSFNFLGVSFLLSTSSQASVYGWTRTRMDNNRPGYKRIQNEVCATSTKKGTRNKKTSNYNPRTPSHPDTAIQATDDLLRTH